jgi:anionic cell wall polymer biosynthesis LytR-Cps2A-Psr (LCP) family protein
MVYENILDFKDLTKILYEETVKLEVENDIKEIDVTKDFFNVYVSGIDTYGSVNKTSRSDVNLVVSVNPKTNKILITSIPRDYYVSLAGKSGLKDKLTRSYSISYAISKINRY